jgi:hypothetical protein
MEKCSLKPTSIACFRISRYVCLVSASARFFAASRLYSGSSAPMRSRSRARYSLD